MNNTQYLKFKELVTATRKTYFRLTDLQKFYASSQASLKVLLSQWAKRGWINQLGRGYYTFDLAQVDYLQLACSLYPQSYVSFEYGLLYYGLINQVSSTITLATGGRSRKIQVGLWILEYTHLKPELLFDYELHKHIFIASPEKALADTLYVMARGQRLVELDSLDIKKINIAKFKKTLERFPGYTLQLAKNMLQFSHAKQQ